MAFSELYRRHYPSLRAFVFHLLGARHHHEDSEDVVQDAFARAFDAISERRFSGDFRRWIYTIARNRSIDLMRGERVRLVALETAGHEVAPQAVSEATTPAVVAETRDEVAWLVGAIDHLPERQRSALLLRELAGLSHHEIAETLDTTTGSARQLITRARDGVRDAAERDGREHETRKGRSLRRGLIDATPMLPLASGAGFAFSAGTTAGGGFALGKIAATVLAAMVLAGSAGQIGREVATAAESPSTADPAPAAQSTAPAAEAPVARADKRDSSPTRPNSGFAKVDPTKPKPASSPAATAPQHSPSNSGSQERDSGKPTKAPTVDLPNEVESRVIEPVKDVVELPGKVVDHVGGVLDGSNSLGETVGKVVGDVTDTVGDVAKRVLGPGPSAD